MTRRIALTVMSLVSILLFSFHFADDIVRGFVGGRIAGSSGLFVWVWTLIAMGATGIVSAILAAQELWNLKKSRASAQG